MEHDGPSCRATGHNSIFLIGHHSAYLQSFIYLFAVKNINNNNNNSPNDQDYGLFGGCETLAHSRVVYKSMTRTHTIHLRSYLFGSNVPWIERQLLSSNTDTLYAVVFCSICSIRCICDNVLLEMREQNVRISNFLGDGVGCARYLYRESRV